MPENATDLDQEKNSKEEIETPKKVEKTAPYKAYETEDDFNNHSANIRKSAEGKILKDLGLSSKDELEKFKKAYENTLTQEEKIQGDLTALRNENATLKAQLAEQECLVSALAKVSGKSTTEMSKLVKMARGLISDDTTVEQAIDEVFSLIKKEDAPPEAKQMPKGKELDQPPQIEVNPFLKETWNAKEQFRLNKEDKAKAVRLAKVAGYNI